MKLRTLTSMFSALVLAGTVSAQQAPTLQLAAPQPQSTILTGTVLDINGGTVPNASVVLQGPNPGDRIQIVTRDDGFFSLNTVKPGIHYHVTASAAGFSDWTSPELVLTPGQYFILTGIKLPLSIVDTTINAVDPEELAVQQVKEAESQRILGIVPNIYVSYNPNPVPLTPKLKFQLAMRALADPVTLTGFAMYAGAYQVSKYPAFQNGPKGYGQRFGATLAGGYTNVLVGDALLPSLLHQDPRYFYRGTGSTKSRFMHAVSSTFIARSDDGRSQVNWSNIGGDLASGALANAYYPERDRGAGLVVSSAIIGAGERVANALMQEFVLRRFTTSKKKAESVDENASVSGDAASSVVRGK